MKEVHLNDNMIDKIRKMLLSPDEDIFRLGMDLVMTNLSNDEIRELFSSDWNIDRRTFYVHRDMLIRGIYMRPGIVIKLCFGYICITTEKELDMSRLLMNYKRFTYGKYDGRTGKEGDGHG